MLQAQETWQAEGKLDGEKAGEGVRIGRYHMRRAGGEGGKDGEERGWDIGQADRGCQEKGRRRVLGGYGMELSNSWIGD